MATSGITASTDVNLDFLTKEEKDALLSKKMDMIRQRNKMINERHEMIEADRRKAEESGHAINKAVDSKTLPAEGAPNKPKGRGRNQGQGSNKDGRGPRPKSHGDTSSYEPIVDVTDFTVHRIDNSSSISRPNHNNNNKGRGGQPHQDRKDGPPSTATPKNRRKPQHKEEAEFRQSSLSSEDPPAMAFDYEPIVDINDLDHRFGLRPATNLSVTVANTPSKQMDGGHNSRHDRNNNNSKGYDGRNNDSNPPPDPTFNPLSDWRRNGGAGGSDRRDNNAERPDRSNDHKRHPRNFGGGADLAKVKDNIKHLREKERERPGGPRSLEMVMTGRERKNHEQWKQERDRYDNDRIQRQLQQDGGWRREWDTDKVVVEYDNSQRKEPAKRPAGRIGSGRFDRGDSREDRAKPSTRDVKGGFSQQSQSTTSPSNNHNNNYSKQASHSHQYHQQQTTSPSHSHSHSHHAYQHPQSNPMQHQPAPLISDNNNNHHNNNHYQHLPPHQQTATIITTPPQQVGGGGDATSSSNKPRTKGRGRGRGRARTPGNQGNAASNSPGAGGSRDSTCSGSKSPRPRTWSGGNDDRFIECEKEILVVKFDNIAGDNSVEVEYENGGAPLSPTTSSKSSGSVPGRGPTGRTPNQKNQHSNNINGGASSSGSGSISSRNHKAGGSGGRPNNANTTTSHGKEQKGLKGNRQQHAGSGRLLSGGQHSQTNQHLKDQFIDAEGDTNTNASSAYSQHASANNVQSNSHRHSYPGSDGSKSRTYSSHSQSQGDSEGWEDCTQSLEEDDYCDDFTSLQLDCQLAQLNPDAPEFLPISPDFLVTPPGHVKVLNWAGRNTPTSPQSHLSPPTFPSQSPRDPPLVEEDGKDLSPVSSPGSSASTRARNRREVMDAMPDADEPMPPPFLLDDLTASKVKNNNNDDDKNKKDGNNPVDENNINGVNSESMSKGEDEGEKSASDILNVDCDDDDEKEKFEDTVDVLPEEEKEKKIDTKISEDAIAKEQSSAAMEVTKASDEESCDKVLPSKVNTETNSAEADNLVPTNEPTSPSNTEQNASVAACDQNSETDKTVSQTSDKNGDDDDNVILADKVNGKEENQSSSSPPPTSITGIATEPGSSSKPDEEDVTSISNQKETESSNNDSDNSTKPTADNSADS